MTKRDNLHFNFRTIDGYNVPFNLVISEREAGKSTAVWNDKAYKAFKEEGRPSMVIRRLINDITDTYINDIQEVINKFQENPILFEFRKGAIKEGIVDVKIDGKLFIRVIALSNPISRIKSLIVRDLRYIIFDEFICNQAMGEKYLPNEAFKFQELYNTFQRETSDLKVYWLGNPYSLYNPYFVWLGADTSKLKPGAIQRGVNWVIQCYQIKPELKEFILQRNPLYQFDNSYKKYAFGGIAINDSNIKVSELPQNFHLRFTFKIEGKYIAVYQNNDYDPDSDRFYCSFIDTISARRTTYCFDFNELVDRTIIMNREDRFRFSLFKSAMRERRISFSSIEVYYLIEEIYYNL